MAEGWEIRPDDGKGGGHEKNPAKVKPQSLRLGGAEPEGREPEVVLYARERK